MTTEAPDESRDAAAILTAGLSHHRSGRLEDAAAAYRRVLALEPEHPEALHLMGEIARQAGDIDGAVAAIRKAIAARPTSPEFYRSLGDAYRAAGDWAGSLEAFRAAADLDPNDAAALCGLGHALESLGRLDEALGAYRLAETITPHDAAVHDGAGRVLQRQGKLERAVAAYRRAILHDPESAEAHSNLGTALEELGELAAAAEALERAIALNPRFAQAHNNLGIVHRELGRHDDAVAAYRKAIALAPDYPEAHHNLALQLLRAGRLDEGWTEFEWRWQCRDFPFPARPFRQPAWDGAALGGRTILVWGEQGVGDEVMFAALVPEIVAAAGRCLVECDPRLVPLFARSFPDAEVVARRDPPDARTAAPDIDVQCPMGSLPRRLRPTLGDFPPHDGYLMADVDRRAACRRSYSSPDATLIVGIAWRSGNKSMGKARTAPLPLWADVLACAGVRFVNLQYGDCAAELAEVRDRFGVDVVDDPAVDPISSLDDFAAQVAAMDLVVSIDNSTVHMAGALGVPVWTLLHDAPDWRWLADRDDSPWYPSMTLLRQAGAGDWAPVLAEVARRLAARVDGAA